ncbi:MAG: hypothetical protein CMH49_04795 [Myxococcales bacterium]|nr:hypothetical protein [Myxococcales bacterium]
MEDFIQVLMNNLEKNQFPKRKVAFDLETLYEKAEDKKISLNNVLDELKKRGIDHIKKGERIIFKAVPQASTDPFGPGFAETMAGMNPDFLAQAQTMMDNMDDDELASTRAMVQERLAGMNDDERKSLFEQIKGMGLS